MASSVKAKQNLKDIRFSKKNPLIKVLEPRIMFDGAFLFSAVDTFDNLESQNNSNSQDISSLSIEGNEALFSSNQSNKEFVFIDSGVNNYQSLIESMDSTKQVYIIDANRDGFIQIQNILQNESNVDAVHLIGHGSAGQIIFGNSTLNAESLNQYSDALRVIGGALTTSGDILFYGCNIAQSDAGQLLVQQIGNITQADIASSTDITGRDGDWELEHNVGEIETRAMAFKNFDGNLLENGIDSINSNVVNLSGATNFEARWRSGNNQGQMDNSGNRFIITLERENITNSGGTLVFDVAGSVSSYVASSSNKINSYIIFLNDDVNRRASASAGSVTFDNTILGIYSAYDKTIDNSYLDKSGATYPSSSATKVNKRIFENLQTSATTSNDWLSLSNSNKTIAFGAQNGLKGDFIRVITMATPTNTAPDADPDYAVVNEDATLNVSNNANKNLSGSYDAAGEHSGDVMDGNSSANNDSDADGDSLTITSFRTGSSVGNGTAGTVGQALTGTYGQLTLNANGSYSYVANQAAADYLDAGDSGVYDYFNYTISDGTTTDTTTIRIEILGVNDDIIAVNDYDAVNEDATITRSSSSSYSVDYDDTDADADDNNTNFTITAIKIGSTEGSGTAGSIGSALTGTYGQLTMNSNGSYSYTANQSAADDLDEGDTAYDYFNYTVSDGTDTDIAVLRITVTGINDAPVAQNDVGVINEDATLTVSNSANANVSGSYDATGEHSGDVINTSSSSHTDSDPDDSASLVVSAIRLGGTEGSGTAGSIGSALTGTYGQLTIAANGSYSYVANQSAADDLDAGDSATDVFNYTLSDGTATDIGTITITVLGLNDPVVAVNDTGSVNEDATLTVSDGSGDIIANNDTDADDSASLVVSAIRLGGTEGSGTAGTLGQALTGTYGQLTLNANGSYTYVANQAAADDLDAGDTATDVFNYTLSDGTATDIATITITVTGINDPVVAVNDTGSVNEDATLTVSDGSGDIIANNDTDADDSASLVVSAIRLGGTEGSGTAGTLGQALTGTYGQLTLNANGSYSYVANQSAADDLDAGDTATDVFNYTLSDGTATDIATITITVTGINDAPVAQNDVGVINEDATLTVSNSANANVSGSYDATGEHSGDVINTSSSSHTDSDPDDSASLVVSAIRLGSSEGSGTAGTLGSALTGTYGTLTMNANGSYTYVADQTAADNLNAGQSATDSFNYTLSDGTATDIGVIQITVLGLNNDSSNAAPSATNDTDAVNANETITRSDGSSQDVQRDDTDSDGDTLTVSAIRTGAESGSGTSGSVGSALTGTYGTLTIAADGSYSYVADQDAADSISDGATATDTFTYTITDGDKTDTAEIVITVTGTSFIAVNDTDSVNEDATVTATDGSSTDVITDDSGSGTLVVSAIRLGGTEGSGTAGTVGSALTGTYGTLTLNANGSYTYVADQAAADALDANDTATDVFNYTLSNGSSTDTATLTITVTGINDPVVATNDTGSVNEDATLTVSDGSGDIIADNDTDADDSASLVVSAIRTGGTEGSGTAGTVGSALTGTYGTLTLNANGSYTYVADQAAADALDANDTATDVFNYTLSDGTATDTATITITVTGVDDDITAVNDTDAVDEDGTISRAAGSAYDIDSDDTDLDDSSSSSITAIRIGGVEGGGTAGTVGSALTGTYGTLTLNANGSYTYVADQAAADALDANDTATDSFNYTVTSGSQTDTATLVITVTGINDPVVAANDTGSVNEDATLTVSDGSGDIIADNDTDADDSASLVVSAIRTGGTEGSGTAGTVGSALTGTYGTLTLNANGSYTYVADQAAADALDANDTATDVFNYTLSDGTATDTATITITVTGVDDDITAVNDTDTVDEDATISRDAGSSYDIDSDDVDLDDSSSSSITAIRIGANEGNGVSGTVGSALTGTYGTLTLNANGSYTYVADQAAADALDANDTATDSFNYTVTSGSQTDIATLIITVTGINDDVIAVNDTDAVTEDSTITRSTSDEQELDADDTDLDASSSTTITEIRLGATEGSGTAGTIGQPLVGTYGTLTVNADGSYTYVADQAAADNLGAGASATDSFNYTVSDGTDTDIATLIITVTGTDPKNNPIAADDTGSVNDGDTLTVSDGASDLIASNDSDADTATSSLTISGIRTGTEGGTGTTGTVGTSLVGVYGTLTVNANGSYTYTANTEAAKNLAPGATEQDYFTYTLTDGVDIDKAQITIDVTGKNNAPTSSKIPIINLLENQKIVIDKTSFFTDPDPAENSYGQLTYTTTGLPSQLTINEDTGKITGTFGPDEYGTYTFTITGTDGGNLSTQETVTILVRKPVPGVDDDVKVNKKGEYKRVKVTANNVEKISLRSTVVMQALNINYSLPEIVKDLSFSGGLKIVDVGSEVMNTKLIPDQKGVTVGFSISDDFQQNVKQYTGVMKDGSALPTWIKIDPSNGQTLTQFPDGVETVEIKIIAIEKDNTSRDINVLLDKGEIASDPAMQKNLDAFLDRSASLKTLVNVDTQGQINLIRENNNVIDESLTSNLNSPNIITNNVPDVFFQEGFEPQATFKMSNIETTDNGFTANVIDDNRSNVKQYSASFENGTPLPQWIKINSQSGVIEANPPSGIEKISFKVLAEDEDGELRILDVELDFTENSNDELSLSLPQNQMDTNGFTGLSEQVLAEYNNYNNYGSGLISRINA